MRKDVVEELEKTKTKKIVGKWLKERKIKRSNKSDLHGKGSKNDN